MRGERGQWPAAQWAERNAPFRGAFCRGAGARRLGAQRGRGSARGRALPLGGHEATTKTTARVGKKLCRGGKAWALWVLSRWPERFPGRPPGTGELRRARRRGTHRCVSLNATVAHSWPLQLLGNERIFFSAVLPPLPPPFVFLPGMELSTLAVQKTFHSHDRNRKGDAGLREPSLS